MQNLMERPTFTAIALTLALGLGIAACQQADQRSTLGVSVGNVLDDPGAYYGSTITVSGAVDEIISPTIFTIQGGEDRRDLLVLSIDSIAAGTGRSRAEPVRQGDIVQVTGRFREFARDDVESEFQLDLSDVDANLDGRPIVVAWDASARLSSVIVTPQPGSIVTPPGETETVTDFAAATADDSDALAGEAAHFENLTVAEVINETSFWAVQDIDSLLVIFASGAVDDAGTADQLQQGQTWEVYGILREVPSFTVLTTGWGLSQDVAHKLQNDPVYLYGIYGIASR